MAFIWRFCRCVTMDLGLDHRLIQRACQACMTLESREGENMLQKDITGGNERHLQSKTSITYNIF